MLTLKQNWCTATYLRGKGEIYVMQVVASGNVSTVDAGDEILVPAEAALPGRNPVAGIPLGTFAIRLADIIGVVT